VAEEPNRKDPIHKTRQELEPAKSSYPYAHHVLFRPENQPT